ncbi:MAG: hypothetical protein GVY29_02505 [Spirochaetes bacterium]|jgi:hypothetical protein|nr:hypothetical protein [Spirochaetota bacterium]
MGLRDIQIPTESVSVGDTTIEVRGVGVADLALLLRDYGPNVAAAFAHIQNSAETSPDADVNQLAMGAFREFPDLAAGLIAVAADDYSPETVETARKLTLPIQVQLLEAIFTLSFRSEGDVEKLVETLTRVANSLSGSRILNKASLSGIGVSADT